MMTFHHMQRKDYEKKEKVLQLEKSMSYNHVRTVFSWDRHRNAFCESDGSLMKTGRTWRTLSEILGGRLLGPTVVDV